MADRPNGMKFLVLGPLDVVGNGEAVLGGPKQRAVLGMLITRVGNVISTDSLIDGIWGESPPGAVQSSLHSYVSNLRTAVGADIERSGGGYVLNADPASVDAVEFQRFVDEGTKAMSANPEAASDALRTGLGLWRGKPYADLIGVEGLQSEIRRLDELRLSAVEARIDADLALGRHQILAGELAALATEYPLRERFQSQLMVALYRDGRQAEALRAYQRTRNYLRDELGVDPSTELQELEMRILNHDPDLLSIRDTVTEHVAFLFTDIAGSTELWETRAVAMRSALARHDEILTKAIDDTGGRLFKHTGDGVLAAFPTVVAATSAAVDAQRELEAADWGDLDLQVRMAVDVGEVDARGGDYFGPPMNRGSRVMSAAHGGQILLSEPAQQALSAEPGVQVRGLGEHRLKGLGAPVRIFQLVADGLPDDFPDLRLDTSTAGPARQFGDAIRGYEVRERLAAGRVSVVYRAFQPTVGREVAVKVIRPEYANHPSFVRRFESEARTVAGLEHPHIVSLYDYWRDADGAYLVMPLMAGGSLADKDLGALPLDRVVGLVAQVGSALGYAHRQGVIHRDIKPSNILLDVDGNAYISDFGIAVRGVERDAGIQSESAIYRAPEDRAGAAVDERSDVYSLARVVAGLLTGSANESPDLTTLDDPLQGLLESAFSEDPASRPESVDSFVGRLNALNGGMTAAAEPIFSRNPYKGLQPFDVADAHDFFGRDNEIRRLTELVGEHRIVTVVGPSGSGKSSLVRAGLIPALAKGALSGSDQWVTVTTVPGSHPFDELASVLGEVAIESMGDMAAELSSDDHGLVRLSKRLMRGLEGELVIVVDQFEELYTVVTSDEVRRSFIRNLIEAAADARSRVRVVLTLRADFYDHPLGDEVLGPIVSEANLALAVPKPAELREAIEKPALNAGVVFEDGLSDQLLTDVQEQPGSLPLMQYALASLVAQSLDGRVSIPDYERLGGVSGALTQRADEVYRSLGEEERAVAEEIFMRLVSVSADADDVRRRVRQSELESLGLEAGYVTEVLEKFGDARLLTFDRDPLTRGPTVEVAHEALLRSWLRFRDWLDDRRETLILHRRFRAAGAEWEESGRDATYLLTGGRLSQFEAWAAGTDVVLTPDETEYLDISTSARDEAEARRRRIRRGVLAGFGVAALMGIVLAVAALVQRNEAQTNELAATSNELALRAEKEISVDGERAMLLAIEAISMARQAGIDPVQATQSLRNALASSRIVQRLAGGDFVAIAPDGSMLATVSDLSANGSGCTFFGAPSCPVNVWDTTSWELIATFTEPDGIASAAAFSPSGDRLAVAFRQVDSDSQPSPVVVYDLAGGPEVRLEGDPPPFFTQLDVEFARGGESIVATRFDADSGSFGVGVWSATTGVMSREFEDGSLDVDPSGERLAIVHGFTDGRFLIHDIGSGEVLVDVGGSGTSTSGAFSLDGTLIAETSQELTRLLIRDAGTGEVLHDWQVDRVAGATWLDGSRVAVGGEGSTRIVNIDTGQVLFELAGHTAPVLNSAAIPGTDLMATAGFDGALLIWDISPAGPTELPIWDTGLPASGFFFAGPDGGLALVPNSETGQALWWLADDGSPAALVMDDLVQARPAQDGTLLTFIGLDGTSGVVSLPYGEVVYTAPEGLEVHATNNDASLVVLGEPGFPETGQAPVVVDTVTGLEVSRLDAPWNDAYQFSPDASLVFSFCCGSWSVYLLPDGEATGGNEGFAARISDDGSILAYPPNLDGDIWLLDTEKLKATKDIESARVAEISAHSGLIFPDFSPDGTMLLTAAFDEPLRVWDITGVLDGSQPTLIAEIDAEPRSGPPAAYFRPNGTHIVSRSVDGLLRVFTIDTDELIGIAQSRLTRTLTPEECATFGIDACPALEEAKAGTG